MEGCGLGTELPAAIWLCARRTLGRLRRLPRLPFGERGLIALERLVVKIENTWTAAALTTVFKFGRHGRLGLRVVDR
ncbi:hypothetical protein LMG28140_02526 [Paraburkholderia metrosideri]|jgi:hypothetical protein|uniref:Transposase n=1 Tax=Paraburkholderia metrosideri TaxID=580937 RepID=A0ABM8NLK0_9BURK|nr:hypothetical protein LMG28140_02526 [Paraburkholderia metrosideri]